MKNIDSFTFCVLSFNHEKFILDHLNSIKFQIINYGKNIDCNIIINDDASTDGTVELIDNWLKKNYYNFKNICKIYNTNNLGTCKGVVNISKKLKTKFFKLTAGDDVYSSTNIFSFLKNNDRFSLLSGLPLRLVDGVVSYSLFEIINYLASAYIYKNESLIDRLSNVSIVNAPNLFYSEKYLKNNKIIEFLSGYDVVEDWPLQIAIALNDKYSNLISSKTNIVLYRRTLGSTYLVANSRFEKDQIKVFDYLINYYKNLNRILKVIMLKNRRYLFIKKSFILKSVFNLQRIIYFFKLIFYIPEIYNDYLSIKLNIKKEQMHYDNLRNSCEV